MIEGLGTEILKSVALEILKKFYGPVKNIWQKVKLKVENSFHKYEKHYRDYHRYLKVSCIGMEAPILLDDIYVDVQFLEQKRAVKYGSLEDIEKAFREESEEHSRLSFNKRQDGMQVANDKQYLMVLGGPGIGKSTFLRKVGLEALKGKDGNFAHECTPVFLELKKLTDDSIDIKALIIHELEICGYPDPKQKAIKALKSGEFLILFDGLDEAPSTNDEVVRKIEDFVNQYSQNRFIVSSRIGAYKGGFTHFTEVEMADFDDSQVEGYINKWFSSRPNLHQFNEDMTAAEQCWEALEAPEHQATKKLACNPLLLTLLCIVYENEQNFPSNRTILYEKALNIFLKKWSAEKHIRRNLPASQYLDILTLKKIFSEIAAKNFKADHVLFSEDKLTNQIQEFFQRDTNIPTTFDASKTLDTIFVDPGFFVERANGVYSFLHLTFQEYLTANYFVSTQSIQQLVAEHLHNNRWREVFLFAAELLPEADNLLIAMEAKATKSIGTDRLKTLFRWAKRITNTPDSQYDKIVKRIFAIRQYFSLWMFNKIYEEVKNTVNRGLDFTQNFDQDNYPDLYLDRDLDMYLQRKGYRGSYLNRKHYRYQSLDSSLDLYINLKLHFGQKRVRGFKSQLEHNLESEFDPEHHTYPELYCYLSRYGELESYLDPYFYQDPYRYMDIDFYRLVPYQLGDWFDSELEGRTTLLRHMEQMKIFKGVNLQRMVQRFKAQRKFIKAAREREIVELPTESIHDTWLSILHITDDMLAISRRDMENYIRYLRAIEIIVACKEAARHVSPDVWQKIEDRLLAWETEESED